MSYFSGIAIGEECGHLYINECMGGSAHIHAKGFCASCGGGSPIDPSERQRAKWQAEAK